MYNITACRRYGGSGRLSSAYLDGIGSRKSNSSSCSSWLMVLFRDGWGSPVLRAEKNGWRSCNVRAVEPVGNNISGYVSIGLPYCETKLYYYYYIKHMTQKYLNYFWIHNPCYSQNMWNKFYRVLVTMQQIRSSNKSPFVPKKW